MTILLPGMPLSYGMPMNRYPQPMFTTPGSSQILAEALGIATPVQNEASTAKRLLKGAGIGALAGAAFGAIPFLPLGIFSGALVGAVVGATSGLLSARKDKKDRVPHTMTAAQQIAALQAQMAARR